VLQLVDPDQPASQRVEALDALQEIIERSA
jgi:hypothetical protein